MEEKVKPVELAAGDMLISAGGDYVLAPTEEMLKFHVVKVAKGEGNNFNTGLPEPRLIVTSELDSEVDGQGQQYSSWFNPKSLNPKSNLAKFSKAVYGEIPTSLDPTDLIGRPFQATLTTKVKEDGSKRQNYEAFFKPDKTQKIVDVVSDDVDPLSDIDQYFPE